VTSHANPSVDADVPGSWSSLVRLTWRRMTASRPRLWRTASAA